MWVKDRIKQVVVGTPIEDVATRTYKWVHNRFFEDVTNARYNRQTSAIMKRALSSSSNCVDVGSSIGDILREMLHYAPHGTHYAFEPRPPAYRRLARSFPTVNVYNLALSDTTGNATFHHVISHAGHSGLRRREYPQQHETIEEIKVKTDLLDNIIPENLPIDFVKIDVEGAELQVLRGAVDTIRRNRPIVVFEHQLGAADYYGTTPEEVYDFFSARCNLRVFLMEHWLKGENPLSRDEFAEQFYRRANFMFVAHA